MKPGNRLNSVLNPTAEMSADEVWFLVPPDLRNRAAFLIPMKRRLSTQRGEKEMKRLFTSESVTEGHPDKICDQISDAVLDAILEQDSYARVASETWTTTGIVMVMG